MSDLFKHKVHVLFRKEDLDHERLEGKVAIVLDVLFATSTIITALASGATEVIPTLDEAGASGRYHPRAAHHARSSRLCKQARNGPGQDPLGSIQPER